VYPDLLRPAGRHDRSSACGRDSSPRTAARLPITVTGGASTSAMPSPSLPLPNSNVVNQTRPIVQSRPVPSAPPPSGRWRACRRARRRARRAVDGGPGPAGECNRVQPVVAGVRVIAQLTNRCAYGATGRRVPAVAAFGPPAASRSDRPIVEGALSEVPAAHELPGLVGVLVRVDVGGLLGQLPRDVPGFLGGFGGGLGPVSDFIATR
jgi:hypothetical protein